MTQVQTFTFNPFSENTYVIFDDSQECIIIDPGCFDPSEKSTLQLFIANNKLRPVRLINTHCHLDHVFGNRFASETWQLGLEIHELDLPVLERFMVVCERYGIPWNEDSPRPSRFIADGETISFGSTSLQALLTPGHSPGSLSFYCADAGFVIAGDVLFHESIGRTDLPGGDFEVLRDSIHQKLFVLPGETIVYPGHGATTTIRHEKEYNPFV
jgi:hydroxyacylglutathione hydrolase